MITFRTKCIFSWSIWVCVSWFENIKIDLNVWSRKGLKCRNMEGTCSVIVRYQKRSSKKGWILVSKFQFLLIVNLSYQGQIYLIFITNNFFMLPVSSWNVAKDNLRTGFASAYFLPVGSKVTMQILETPAGVTGCWFPRLMNSCSAKLLLTQVCRIMDRLQVRQESCKLYLSILETSFSCHFSTTRQQMSCLSLFSFLKVLSSNF